MFSYAILLVSKICPFDMGLMSVWHEARWPACRQSDVIIVDGITAKSRYNAAFYLHVTHSRHPMARP